MVTEKRLVTLRRGRRSHSLNVLGRINAFERVATLSIALGLVKVGVGTHHHCHTLLALGRGYRQERIISARSRGARACSDPRYCVVLQTFRRAELRHAGDSCIASAAGALNGVGVHETVLEADGELGDAAGGGDLVDAYFIWKRAKDGRCDGGVAR